MAEKAIRDEILDYIETVEKLPTLPIVVELINRELANQRATATSIAKIIEDDPSIMTRVLKLVNSPLYAPTFRSRKGVTLQAAVVRLGMYALRDLVLSTSVMTLFPTRRDACFDRVEFWRHSICVGLIARVIKDFSPLDIPYEDSELALAGLCHDVGKVVLDQYFNDRFQDVLGYAKEKSLLVYEAENALLELDHGEVGAALARRWKLPEQYGVVMRYHHYPERIAGRQHEILVRIVQLADYVCNHQDLGFSGNCRTMEFPRESFEALGLGFEIIPDLIERVHKEAEHSDILLSIGTGAPV